MDHIHTLVTDYTMITLLASNMTSSAEEGFPDAKKVSVKIIGRTRQVKKENKF